MLILFYYCFIPGLYTHIAMFSEVVDTATLLNMSARCDAPVFGDILSWDDVISNSTLAPSLRQSVCDGMYNGTIHYKYYKTVEVSKLDQCL